MKIFGLNISIASKKPVSIEAARPKANNPYIIPLGAQALPFDGEKNVGEMGIPTNYVPQYYLLSIRSWEAYTTSPLAKTVIDKWVNWIVGEGLKIKANPAKTVLETEGINMSKETREAYNDIVEARWNVWANSKNSSFTGNTTFNQEEKEIYINSKIGGDVLVVLRLINNVVKIQKIDGSKVKTPFEKIGINKDGSFVSNGVHVSGTGTILGYHICMDGMMKFEYIPAKSKATGLTTAFLVKGSKWRIDYHRGIPAIAAVMETLSKVDRYREATVGSAEEVAKIAYQVVHQNYSDGSNPLQQQLAAAFDADAGTDLPEDEVGNKFAENLGITTNKQAFNNPKGAKIETINPSTNITGFEDFYTSQANIIAACIGIPPNVAMSIYNDSFSASRAATKDWDHTMDIERADYYAQCLSHVYKFWLFVEIANGKVPAVGYLQAFNDGNFMVTESYEKARFTGPHFPHIDPVKEVKAERLKLGDEGKNMPLATAQQATENVGVGDYDSNLEKFSDELSKTKKEGVIEEPPEPTSQPTD